MNFQVGDLMDPDLILNGPVVVYWGQDAEVHPRPDLVVETPPAPKPKWRQRRKGYRPWEVMIRLQPPPDEDLDEWGGRVCAALELPFKNSGRDDDKAIWIPGSGLARSAPEAIASACTALERLQGFSLAAAQIKVKRMDCSGRDVRSVRANLSLVAPNLSLVAPNLSDAQEKAEQAFQDFYDDQPFEIVEESAESHSAVETAGGKDFRVVTWRCDFTAEGGEA